MQKVSKQSLAMLALSILLAISIALTLTFAALSQQKTATGTITFDGNVALELTGFEGGPDSFTFTINNPTDASVINSALAGYQFALASTSQNAYISVKIVITGQSGITFTQTSEPTGYNAATGDAFATGYTWMSTNAFAVAGSTGDLADFITAEEFATSDLVIGSDGNVEKVSINVTIKAGSNVANATIA